MPLSEPSLPPQNCHLAYPLAQRHCHLGVSFVSAQAQASAARRCILGSNVRKAKSVRGDPRRGNESGFEGGKRDVLAFRMDARTLAPANVAPALLGAPAVLLGTARLRVHAASHDGRDPVLRVPDQHVLWATLLRILGP
jgi:hypothetical protein